jgi:RNA polymerase sigma-70 factor (ECF subfamily)
VDLARELSTFHASSWGWALACCKRDAVQAEDVLQQAYFKVLEGKARFGGTSSLKTWFFGVIRITALEHRRWRWFAPEKDSPASTPQPDSLSARKQTAEEVSRALARLSDRQREVLHLVFYEELTIEEAAAIMGISLGSARQHYDRGKKNLRQMLGKEGR